MGYIEKLREKIGHMRILLPGCNAIIQNEVGQILLQQRTYPRGKWGLPGGLMELGESTEETVRREVLEETGLRLGNLTLFGVYSGQGYRCKAENGDEFDVVIIVYITNDFEGEAVVMDDESISFEWFALDSLPENIAGSHKRIIGDLLIQATESVLRSHFVTPTALGYTERRKEYQ